MANANKMIIWAQTLCRKIHITNISEPTDFVRYLRNRVSASNAFEPPPSSGFKEIKFHRNRNIFQNKNSIRRRFYRVTENDGVRERKSQYARPQTRYLYLGATLAYETSPPPPPPQTVSTFFFLL